MRNAFRSSYVYGVVFLALCVLFVWFTYAIFTKKFADYDEVTLESSSTGLSLPARADVKIRGVRVGEVLAAETSGDDVDLKLGIYPSQRDTIPKNVTARILPKTLACTISPIGMPSPRATCTRLFTNLAGRVRTSTTPVPSRTSSRWVRNWS